MRILGRHWFLTCDDLYQHYLILLYMIIGYLASQHLGHVQSEQDCSPPNSKLPTCKAILPNEYASHSMLSDTAVAPSSSSPSGTSNSSAAAHRIFPLMDLVK